MKLFARQPRVGDRARISSGPHAGQSGSITALRDGTRTIEVQVYIDECCQPWLTPKQLVAEGGVLYRLLGIHRRVFAARHDPARGHDEEYERIKVQGRIVPPPL
jgi:hypothetical protein